MASPCHIKMEGIRSVAPGQNDLSHSVSPLNYNYLTTLRFHLQFF